MKKGSCLCGELKYQVTGPLNVVMNCHCKFCRKAHSAPYITASLVPQNAVEITAGSELIAEYDFGDGRKRCYCSDCGTRVLNRIPRAGLIAIMVATLDDHADVVPGFHINVESKLEYLKIDDDLPQYRAFPSQEEFANMFRA